MHNCIPYNLYLQLIDTAGRVPFRFVLRSAAEMQVRGEDTRLSVCVIGAVSRAEFALRLRTWPIAIRAIRIASRRWIIRLYFCVVIVDVAQSWHITRIARCSFRINTVIVYNE